MFFFLFYISIQYVETKDTRNKEKYVVNIARTERYKKSAIPFMQRLLLNKDVCEKKKII